MEATNAAARMRVRLTGWIAAGALVIATLTMLVSADRNRAPANDQLMRLAASETVRIASLAAATLEAFDTPEALGVAPPSQAAPQQETPAPEGEAVLESPAAPSEEVDALAIAAAERADARARALARLVETLGTGDEVLELSLLDRDDRVMASSVRPAGEELALELESADARLAGAYAFAPGTDAAGASAVLLTAPIAGRSGSRIGRAVLRVSTAALDAAHRSARNRSLVTSLLAIGLLVGGVYWLFGRLLDPIDRVERALGATAEGAVDTRVDPDSLGPLADIGRALNRVGETYAAIATEIVAMTERLGGAVERIARIAADLQTGTRLQADGVDHASSQVNQIDSSIKDIVREVEGLSRSTEEASSSVLEMGSSVDEVARSMDLLHQAVESASSSSQEMGASVRQVADSADEVQRMAEETAASMMQMDRAIGQVSDHVRQASELTEQVSAAAEDGSRAVSDTIEGISEIRSVSLDTQSVLERLAHRISEIGEIVNVIGSINDETNLLSLNAAIIAAQAGEQGKAFAVVANHVKTLAQRTANSTQEIERLIGSVQEESANAMSAMGTGLDSVEAGVQRSRRAGEVLQTIRASASDANQRVSEIARAAAEQERNSRHVTEAANRTSAMVQQISNAMAEQSRTGEQVLRTSESSLEVCRQVHRSTEEQRETGRFITESVTTISEMMRSIQENLGSHIGVTQQVAETVETILDGANKNGAHIGELAEVVEELRGDAASLGRLLESFRAGALASSSEF